MAICEFNLELQSGNAQYGSKSTIFNRVTLKFDRGPGKIIGHLSLPTSSFVHHFVAIGKFKLELQSESAQFGSKLAIFCSVWPWNLTDDLKKTTGHLLFYFKLCASFRSHMRIQTGVTVRKQLNRVLTSMTLIFDLWPWPLAWTSRLPMVIIPENFMMIWWQEHSEKGVTDRGWQMDGRADGHEEVFLEQLGRS